MTVRETRRLKFIISFVSVTKAATSCDVFLRQVTKFSDDDDIPPNVLDDSDFLNSIARYSLDPVRNYADQNCVIFAPNSHRVTHLLKRFGCVQNS